MIIKDLIQSTPTNPGCYLFKNKLGRVIYIGKAKNLSKRVKSYFQKKDQDIKTEKLVKEITDFEYIVTDNEVEALLLEAELIKKHQPKYNIQLKTGVRYAYIKITKDKFPKLETARLIKKTDKVFGPYTTAATRKEAMRLANSLFKLRVCRKLPKRACLLYHIKQCSAPCINQISESDYNKNVKKAELLLKGDTKDLLKKLKKEMKDYSDKLNYELAKIRRDQILALQNLKERQKVSLHKRYNQDVINFKQMRDKIIIQLFNINKGVISGRKEFKFNTPISTDPKVNLAHFIRQYYFTHDIPQEIIIPGKVEDQVNLEKYLSKIATVKVNITIPQKGDKMKLLELVKKNIEVGLKTGESGLLELQEKLSLPTFPRIIEAFDASNLGATNVVGSMVHFKDGIPDKNNYRKFKIKTFEGQSDFDAIKEIVYRRYYRLVKERSNEFPNLILIDGGKPQLSAAMSALRELGLQIPVASIAKKEEEIFTPFNQYSIKLSKKSAGLKLIQRIRDEAHRFAISYHRLLRSKTALD